MPTRLPLGSKPVRSIGAVVANRCRKAQLRERLTIGRGAGAVFGSEVLEQTLSIEVIQSSFIAGGIFVTASPPTPCHKATRPHSRLVVHDILMTRPETDRSQIAATVECERRGCTLSVKVCAGCERFARIEVHEAGYTLLCRSTDTPLDPTLSESAGFGRS